eukprot:GEMP01080587.1.p1 GENE.GEMP01080587.1~~GEMP01080587.1.p1  ORF type:complete len:176 (+),score=39.10 GEMP01080587.1:103-630(+)
MKNARKVVEAALALKIRTPQAARSGSSNCPRTPDEDKAPFYDAMRKFLPMPGDARVYMHMLVVQLWSCCRDLPSANYPRYLVEKYACEIRRVPTTCEVAGTVSAAVKMWHVQPAYQVLCDAVKFFFENMMKKAVLLTVGEIAGAELAVGKRVDSQIASKLNATRSSSSRPVRQRG